MRREREEPFDASQPALIVTYGNTTRKHRLLDRDLLVLGRSSCCDFGLVSPEVAPIHCVIVRTAGGWRVRDCTGRSGTRLNGKAVHEETLTDGDILQVGTFSFQLNLPRAATAEPPPVDPSQFVGDRLDVAKFHRLQKSRDRLARRALEMRKQLQQVKSGQHPAVSPAPPVTPSRFEAELGEKRAELEALEKKLEAREAELNEQDRAIRNEYRDLEKQRKELERFAQEALAKKHAELERKADGLLAERRKELEAEVERELAERRAELDRLAETLRARERELADERGRLEEDVRKKERELGERLRQAEELSAQLAQSREALRLEFEAAVRTGQEAQREAEARVREAEAHVAALWEQCEAHRRRVEAACGPLGAPPETAPTPGRDLDIRARELDWYARHLRRTRLTLGQYEQELAEAYHQFHAEYDRAVQEAEAVKERPGTVTEEAVAEARREGEHLRAELKAKSEAERARAEKAEGQLNALRDELAVLREDVRQREEVIEHLKAQLKREQDKSSEASLSDEFELAAPEQLLATVERLQREIADRDAHIRELRHRIEEMEALADPAEKEAYEAELNNYRLELEQDRAALADELTRLQTYRAELEEAKREAEAQTSRERAQLAKEWAEVSRLREELRREQGTAQKPESSARERLKGKQGKGDAAETPPASQAPRPPAQADLIARLARGSKHGNRKDEG
jgi:pSer/pThr/pTyr-binding forkhead associated (FHA) protein